MAVKNEDSLSESEMILELEKKKNSIHHEILKLIAKKNKSIVKGKQRLKVLQSLNNETLFVDNNEDVGTIKEKKLFDNSNL